MGNSIPDWFLLHSWNRFLAPSRLLKYPIYRYCLEQQSCMMPPCIIFIRIGNWSETVWTLPPCIIFIRIGNWSETVWTLPSCNIFIRIGNWSETVWTLPPCIIFIRIGNWSSTVWTLPTCIICIRVGNCLNSAGASLSAWLAEARLARFNGGQPGKIHHLCNWKQWDKISIKNNVFYAILGISFISPILGFVLLSNLGIQRKNKRDAREKLYRCIG
jgi:hypothetical protein